MKCLVTGGSGFIGSHIVDDLAARSYQVVVIDDESAPENSIFYKNDHKNVTFVKANICDQRTNKLYKNVDIVFHLAARSRIQPSFNNPRHTFENNVIGTQCVMNNSVEHGVKRVIYSGSSSCYGLTNKPPMMETMPANCLNHYALSKYQGEQIAKLYSEISSIEVIVLRYFNVYGPREPLNGQYAPVIGIFKKQKESGNALTVVGDGEQRRDFTYVKDVVDANILAAELSKQHIFEYDGTKKRFEIFNIGSGKNYSINQIADMVGGQKLYISPRKGEARVTLAENTKARSILGWKPQHSLEDMIFSY